MAPVALGPQIGIQPESLQGDGIVVSVVTGGIVGRATMLKLHMSSPQGC